MNQNQENKNLTQPVQPAGLVVTPQSSAAPAPTPPPAGNRDERTAALPTPPPAATDSELAYSPADLLNVLLVSSPDPIYFKDLKSRFVCYSQAFSNMYQLTNPDALKGKSDFDLFTEEHARQAYEDEQRIIQTGEPVIGKLERETHTGGRVTWALSTKMPWRNRAGEIVGTFGIYKDVTALKETEEKLAHERQLFHALVETFPDAIYFKDRESRFVKLSRSKVEPARKALLNRHREKHGPDHTEQLAPHLIDVESCAKYLIGKTDFDLMDANKAQEAWDQEQEIMRTGQPLISRLEQILDEDGKPAWRLT